jgi:signal transduction histidine kinase
LRWPLKYQFFLPFACLLAVAVATTSLNSSYLSSQRAIQERILQSQRIINTLSSTRLPYSRNVLEQMRGLSGGHFVVVAQEGSIQASTLSLESIPADWRVWQQPLTQAPTPAVIRVGETDYSWSVLEPPTEDGPIRVAVLISQASLRRIQWQAAWPPLAIGMITVLIMLFVSGWLSIRQSHRIRRVQESLAALARGDQVQLPPANPDDEVGDLIRSTNELSRQLADLQVEIRRTEQLRVLGQLASGLAHQLRNAVAGARLAIQLHLRRHADQDSASLDTALNQLELTNRQIQSLLSLSRQEQEAPEWVELKPLVDEILMLVRPNADHWHVAWTEEIEWGPGCQVDRQPMQAAFMNLLINAIEAAGEQGRVVVRGSMEEDVYLLDIQDNGTGVPPEFEARMFEPFATTKPEGVGIGLTMAKQAIERHGGTLTYERCSEHTHFWVRLPKTGSE